MIEFNSTTGLWSEMSRIVELSLVHTAHLLNAPEGALLSAILLVSLIFETRYAKCCSFH